MSRVGKLPIEIPENVEVNIDNGIIEVKGKLGTLTNKLNESVLVEIKENSIVCSPNDKSNFSISMWGTLRSIINNMVLGVSKGFEKKLEISGVGYKSEFSGNILTLSLGYSHEIKYAIPSDIKVVCEKPTIISIFGICNQKVGSIASDIINFRPTEPYKGKGIKHQGSIVRRKEGKKK